MTDPGPAGTAHPVGRAGRALQRHGDPCRSDAGRAPHASPIHTPHVEIDIFVRGRRRRHCLPRTKMSISTGKAPADRSRSTGKHGRVMGHCPPARNHSPKAAAHHCVPLALNPHTKPGCTWEKGTLMKQGLLFFDIPTLPLVHQGQLTVSHVHEGGPAHMGAAPPRRTT